MLSNKKNIAALLVAYNEGSRIANVIKKIKNYTSEVIVVDDGSTDNTKHKVQSMGITVFSLRKNLGKGAAIKKGFSAITKSNKKYDAVILLDADGQHDPADIPKMLQVYYQEKPELLVGRRSFNKSQMPASRIWWNRFVSSLVSRLLSQRLLDTQSGFRVLSLGFVKTALPKIKSNDYTIETELLFLAKNLNGKILETPVKTIYNKTKFSENRPLENLFRAVKIILFICNKTFFGDSLHRSGS
jgi:glycosyltransferase involved in cell wall biosynthesis